MSGHLGKVATLVALIITGCGAFEEDKPKKGSLPSAYLPDYLVDNPAIQPVPPGSLAVVALPTDRSQAGLFPLELIGEPGATITYSFAAFGAADPGSVYEAPLLVRAPVTVWAYSEKEGSRGEVQTFEFGNTPGISSVISSGNPARLPYVSLAQAFNPRVTTPSSAAAVSLPIAKEPESLTIGIDGAASDWTGSRRTFLLDGPRELKASSGGFDIAWIEAAEDPDHIFAVMAFREAPEAALNTAYGFEIGASQITTASFGPGAIYSYKVELKDGILTLSDKETGAAIPLTAKSSVGVADVIEFKIAKADLPALAQMDNIALRFYAIDARRSAVITDRTQPVFLRSDFTLTRFPVVLPAERNMQVDLLANTNQSLFLTNTTNLSQQILASMEQVSGVPFYELGSVPLYFVPEDINGYAGLNTSDRGILTTVGPGTSVLAQAQLLAHEYAHLQNASASRLKERWLQEGYSEWVSARYLYQNFPTKAVYRFLKSFRVDDFFEENSQGLDRFPLQSWGTSPSRLGYAKTMMFFDLLTEEVGSVALQKALQLGVNYELTAEKFQSFLEVESGKSLDSVFQYWVFAGDPASGYDPRVIFIDIDGDGLLTTHEQSIGSDPTKADTDGDGAGDGEEFFRGTDPLVAEVPVGSGPNLVASSATSPLMRLASGEAEIIAFNSNPGDTSGVTVYESPLLLRPPYTIAAAFDDGGTSLQDPVTLQQPLKIGGNTVAENYPARRLLPATDKIGNSPLAPVTLSTLTDKSLTVKDPAGDMPVEWQAYDITQATVAETVNDYVITLNTVKPPDIWALHGSYEFEFYSHTWEDGNVTSSNAHTVGIEGDLIYLETQPDEQTRNRALVRDGIETSFGTALTITISKQLLTDWVLPATGGEKSVCIYTKVTTTEGFPYKDRAGCAVFRSSFTAVKGASPDTFGLGDHALTLAMPVASYDESLAQTLVTAGLAGLNHFESLLGRPLFERNDWVTHVFVDGIGPVGQADLASGALINYRPNVTDIDNRQFLYVEQLARLLMTDLLDRHDASGVAFWIQESYIQWLTAGAMYELYDTAKAQAFHTARIDGYENSLAAYSGYVPLEGWNVSTLNSNGSVKTLAFTLYLDAVLGSDVMAKAYATFHNEIPTTAQFKDLLLHYAPEDEAVIESAWETWVTGSGNSITDQDTIRLGDLNQIPE